MHGGETQAVALTADLVARAVIAAARAYGDDPVEACTCHPRAAPRRVITATAGGLQRLGVSFEQLERVLQVKKSAIYSARTKRGERFARAELDVATAVAHAGFGWEPVRLFTPGETIKVLAPLAAEPEREFTAGEAVRVQAPADLPAQRPPRVLAPKAVQREVLEVLALEPCTGPDLVEVLELGEGQVRQALRELSDAGQVRPLGGGGWRAQTWAVVEGTPA